MARSPGSRLPPPPLARPRRPSSPPPGRARLLAASAHPAPRCPAAADARGSTHPGPGRPRRKPRAASVERGQQLPARRTQAALASSGRHLRRNSRARARGGGSRPEQGAAGLGPSRRGGHWSGPRLRRPESTLPCRRAPWSNGSTGCGPGRLRSARSGRVPWVPGGAPERESHGPCLRPCGGTALGRVGWKPEGLSSSFSPDFVSNDCVPEVNSTDVVPVLAVAGSKF